MATLHEQSIKYKSKTKATCKKHFEEYAPSFLLEEERFSDTEKS
jgi:uncharacterized protein YecA (UPF0149 family)